MTGRPGWMSDPIRSVRKPAIRRDADGVTSIDRSWASLTERLIVEAQERGDFDDLPGHGRPLELDSDPREGDMGLAFHILRNARAGAALDRGRQARPSLHRRDGSAGRPGGCGSTAWGHRSHLAPPPAAPARRIDGHPRRGRGKPQRDRSIRGAASSARGFVPANASGSPRASTSATTCIAIGSQALHRSAPGPGSQDDGA